MAVAAASGLMLSTYALVGAAGSDSGSPSAAPGAGPRSFAGCEATHDKRQMRGAWLTTVGNIDWPSKPGLSAEEQKKEMDERLDEAVDLDLNTVFLHVRPTADAVYESDMEPWSKYLTGEQGGDPGYDPLEYAVEEAHKRGLELHAWFNPYRVGMNSDIEELADDHPAKENPDWLVTHGREGYFDPGNPDVRNWVTDVIMDVVERYDIDGVHFDDFFYPYPAENATFDDDESWEEHGEGFDDRDQWRRNNVNQLIRDVDERIEETKPWVRFGISPFGIWRNDTSDSSGSPTSGLESYSAQHADTRAWIREEIIDYVVPQLYWERGFDDADYEKLVPWWSEEVKDTDVDLYIGQAAYRAEDKGWNDKTLSKQLDYSSDYSEVDGDVYFSFKSLKNVGEKAYERVRDDHYGDPVLPPLADESRDGEPTVGAVEGLDATTDDDRTKLEWQPVEGARSYAVYKLDSEDAAKVATGDLEQYCDVLSEDNLVAMTGETSVKEKTDEDASYVVTALDDYRVEGPAEEVVTPKG
ncbi:family 10 glycosylhydrolase [Nocardiopsis sp. ATB16-24]|uniref:glycoside hydrolase family 10 protein n=1 Tax=Nocardiopsis sp. ATB16-24 TaxID=3019555 RepID=UPI002556BB97|nr:family 10 glycosylhydrolase [Nocardiopsis sp. ATB16-24]